MNSRLNFPLHCAASGPGRRWANIQGAGWRAAALVLGLGLCALPAGGQTMAPAQQRASVRKQIFDTSAALFAAQDYANGQDALFSNNVERSGTLAWSLESANKLTQTALYFRAKYDYRTSLALATLALTTLQNTKGTSASSVATTKQLGQVYELSGFIYEELLRDLSAAKSSYQQALVANKSSGTATAALARIAALEASYLRNGGGK